MNQKDEKITRVFEVHNGFGRTKDMLACGAHARDIKRMRDEGQIEARKGTKARCPTPHSLLNRL